MVWVLSLLVLAFALVQDGGSAPSIQAAKPAPRVQQSCPFLRKGIAWYRARIVAERAARGLETPRFAEKPRTCKRVREVADLARTRAQAEAARTVRWNHYHYAWWDWLPDKWQRVGACETGYGKRPGNWRHSNSAYQGAFGFAVSSWDAFVPRADGRAGPYPSEAWQATPRQQYEVALAIWRMYGFSGWGCRGA